MGERDGLPLVMTESVSTTAIGKAITAGETTITVGIATATAIFAIAAIATSVAWWRGRSFFAACVFALARSSSGHPEARIAKLLAWTGSRVE
jgi:hypothetical protein